MEELLKQLIWEVELESGGSFMSTKTRSFLAEKLALKFSEREIKLPTPSLSVDPKDMSLEELRAELNSPTCIWLTPRWSALYRQVKIVCAQKKQQ